MFICCSAFRPVQAVLPTIAEQTSESITAANIEERKFEVSSDVDDDDYSSNSRKELRSPPNPLLRGDNEEETKTPKSADSIVASVQQQKSPSPISEIIKPTPESVFHNAPQKEEERPHASSPLLNSRENAQSKPSSPNPEDTLGLYNSKVLEEYGTPNLAFSQTHKSPIPSPTFNKTEVGNDSYTSPVMESKDDGKMVKEAVDVSSKHSSGDGEDDDNDDGDDDVSSSRSSSPIEVGNQQRPDPIGGISTVSGQQYEEEKYKISLEEVEEETSENSDSTEYSSDSARGDSLLPNTDEKPSMDIKTNPKLVLMDPSEGPAAGNYEVCLYGIHLNETVMRYAQIFVGVYNVPRTNWTVVPGRWPNLAPSATHCLQIRVPPMPPGEAWIEVETVNAGRLQGPRPFVFIDNSMKHSMRGMGGVKGTDYQPISHKLAPSFADFEFTPEEKTKTNKMDSARSLNSARAEIANLYNEISQLKGELEAKSADEMRIVRELCLLRTRLLEDGQLKYLERR